MSAPTIHDDRACQLGEGPLWHPLREQLFWFDILGKRLLTRKGNALGCFQFDEHVSAAGWIDHDNLLIASESCLFRFNLESHTKVPLVALEDDLPATRSNDGRADPWGGFWIGTMGKAAEPGLGAIYRFYRGELRRLYADISISNAICFSPDHGFAFFTDTPTRKIMRQALDAEGWPLGAPEVFIDLQPEELNPDGAVVDAGGCLWVAQWGRGRVARYDLDGAFLSAIDLPASQTTCPAFGAADGKTLFVTSAAQGVQDPKGGQTFAVPAGVRGQTEHRVIL